MTIRHHISEQLLLAHACGQLPEAFNLVVAAHLSLCDECRARAGAFDALGGAVIDGAEGVAMADEAVEAALARITGCPREVARPPLYDDRHPQQASPWRAQSGIQRKNRSQDALCSLHLFEKQGRLRRLLLLDPRRGLRQKCRCAASRMTTAMELMLPPTTTSSLPHGRHPRPSAPLQARRASGNQHENPPKASVFLSM